MYKRDLIVRSNCVSINIKDNMIKEELLDSFIKSKRIEVKISNIIFYSYVKNMKGILSS